MRLQHLFSSTLLGLTCLLTAQQPTATFQTSTQLVIQTVNVKDKTGKVIEGLTAKDFTVTEDGVPQTIKFFEFQKLDEVTDAPVAPTAAVEPYAKLARTQIAHEPPGDLKYRDRRLLALYFDMTAMPVQDQLRAFAAAEKFVRSQMTPADLMAIMTFAIKIGWWAIMLMKSWAAASQITVSSSACANVA